MKNSQIGSSFARAKTFDDDLPRTTTKNTNVASSSQQLKKVIKDLQKALRQEVQKRKQAEDTLFYYRKRAVNRETQFRNILEKLGYNRASLNDKTIDQLYLTILHSFDETNQKALSLFEKKLRINSTTLSRRIEQIRQKAQQELSKNRKFSSSIFELIKKQLEQTRDLAIQVDKQNEQFRNRIAQLEFQLKILKEERNTILQQLLSKKKILSKAVTQLSNMKKQNNVQEEKNMFEKLELQEKNKFIDADTLFQDISMPTTHKRTIQVKKHTQTNTRNCTSLNNSTVSFYPNKYGNKNTQNISNYRKNSSLRRNKKTINEFLTLQDTQQLKKHTIQSNPEINRTLVTMQNTIKHLQSALQRQRKKKTQYGNLVTQLTFRNNEINKLIQQCLLSNDGNNSNTQNNKKITKNEKLFQAIKDIKKRLKMIEPPTVNCGWGDDQQQLKKLMML